MTVNMARLLKIRCIFECHGNKLFSSKIKNHYDSLEINQKATQGEIKAAYYKLSMQYHPDKNSSEEAETKFRDIKDAYEILTNFEKRKQYDRSIKVRSQVYRKRDNIKPEDIDKEAHRVHMEIMRHKTQPDGTPIYDFDAWTKAHYGKTFDKTRKARASYEAYRDAREEKIKASMSESAETAFLAIFIIVIFSIVIFVWLLPPDFTTPKNFQANKINNNNSSKKDSDSS